MISFVTCTYLVIPGQSRLMQQVSFGDPSGQVMKAVIPVKKEIPETVPSTATTSAASTTVSTPAESTGSVHEQPRIDWNTLMEEDCSSSGNVSCFRTSEPVGATRGSSSDGGRNSTWYGGTNSSHHDKRRGVGSRDGRYRWMDTESG